MEGKILGLVLLISGFIILIGYFLYMFVVRLSGIDPIVAISICLILIGLTVIMISIAVERGREIRKLKEEIKKEDLRP